MYGKLVKGDIIYSVYQGTREHQYAKGVDGKDVGEAPDMIKNDPNLYLSYVHNLAQLLAINYNKDIKTVDFRLFEMLANYAHARNVSLIGIIHYQIAKLQKLNKFILPYPTLGRYNSQDNPTGVVPTPALRAIAISGERVNYSKWVESATQYIKVMEPALNVTRRREVIYLPPDGQKSEHEYEATFEW